MNWYLSDQCETLSYIIATRVHPNNDSSNNNWKIVSFTTYSMYKTIHNANALLYGWWMIQSCIDKGGYNCRVRQQRKDYIDIVNIRVVLIINNFIAYSKQCKKFFENANSLRKFQIYAHPTHTQFLKKYDFSKYAIKQGQQTGFLALRCCKSLAIRTIIQTARVQLCLKLKLHFFVIPLKKENTNKVIDTHLS